MTAAPVTPYVSLFAVALSEAEMTFWLRMTVLLVPLVLAALELLGRTLRLRARRRRSIPQARRAGR